MKDQLPDILRLAELVTQRKEWRAALNASIPMVRSLLVFDNLALYLLGDKGRDVLDEIVYAKSVGRGKSAEADASWGEDVASEVIEGNKLVVREPSEIDEVNRVRSPFMLGMPLRTAYGLVGAVVFVRFGGPAYTPDQVMSAQMIATQFSSLFERKKLQEQVETLQDARRVIALQEDFIATLSHELRTPLGFIKGYSTTLLRNDTVWDEATQHEFLTIIDEEADKLNLFLQNILESARLQSETLPINFQPIRLDALLKDAAVRAHARYREMQIELNTESCKAIMADGVRLAQVFENLFNNAAKYAKGSPVKVSLICKSNGQVIRFEDQGPGIPAEHLPFIFDRFYRVAETAGSGSGLGLFICKKIIEAHGAKLSAESPHGGGAIFVIDFPIHKSLTH